jgi:hypothetical protein
MHDAPSSTTPSGEQLAELLTAEQSLALASLMQGKSVRASADEARIHRNTITRWIHGDPVFRAAYNAWRQEMMESARARVLRLAEDAAATVANAVAAGDVKVSLAVLKDLGLTRPDRRGSTDPALIAQQIEIARRVDENRVADAWEHSGHSWPQRERLQERMAKTQFLPAQEGEVKQETSAAKEDAGAVENPTESDLQFEGRFDTEPSTAA